MENTKIEQVVINFAKTNKIGKSKVQAMIDEVIASLPKTNKMGKVSSGKTGRPQLDKTKQIQDKILLAVKSGFRERRAANLVRAVTDLDPATFQNNVKALINQGKLYHCGKAQSGKRGRQPFILSTIKPE